MEDLTAQELVKYTLRVVKHEYEGQAAGILGQQRRGSGHVDTLHQTCIRCKRVDRELDEGVARAKVALKGLAERWATANDHLLAPETCTWEEFKRLFRTRFCPSDFEQKLRKDIFTVRQYTGETVRAYAERYQIAIALLASETEPLDGLLNIHRK